MKPSGSDLRWGHPNVNVAVNKTICMANVVVQSNS